MKKLFRLPFSKSVVSMIILTVGMMLQITKPMSAQVIPVGQTFSSDTIFKPFSGNAPVYSLYLYGSVQLFSDSSLLRVVLVDAYGNNLLIYESYPLITDSNTFSIVAGCDETCFMPGIIPDSLRVDIISAFCTIDSLKIDPNFIADATALQAQVKWNTDSIKIETMNRRIREEHMYWRAGRTGVAQMSFSEKEALFGSSSFNFEGFEYYKGGIFGLYSQRKPGQKSGSSIISKFNWRDRHGANNPASTYFEGHPSPYFDGDTDYATGWVTAVQTQIHETCWAYASVAALEARINLYFNKHFTTLTPEYKHIDLDLSEWNIVACLFKKCPDNDGWPSESYPYMEDYGVVDQHCLENDCGNYCDDKCTSPVEKVSIAGWDTVHITNTNEDWLKISLIKNGPLTSTVFPRTLPQQPTNHCMLLVGYLPVNSGDKIYSDKKNSVNNIVIDNESDLVGQTAWIFKNSWGNDWGESGFTTIENGILFNRFCHYLYATCRATGEVIRQGHANSEIVWSDEDEDGYFWWGIGAKPDSCPGNPEDEDCDDSDPDLGPYNLDPAEGPLYECKRICSNFNSTSYDIEEDEIIETDRHFNRNVIIMPGHTLTIKNCTVSFSEPGKIIVRQNGKLILENAILTTKCENAMWGGIEVYGNSGFPQSDLTYHGYVEMSNSTIENSTCGITTVQYEYNQDSGGAVPVPLMSGGKITAVNSKFINNYLAVEFYPYSFENESSFNYCTFKTTDDYVGADGPDYFVRMSGVNGIPFTCCSFINTRNSYYNCGGGLYSFNSSIDIKNQGCYSEGTSLFQGLARGIYAINSGDDKSIEVKDADFKDNMRGIYLSGMGLINSTKIVSNLFQIHEPSSAIDIYPYGVYLNNCSWDKIEENTFEPFATNNSFENIKIGLIVNNSGSENNLIYRNTFKKLYAGIIAQNRNRSANGLSGLEIKCNVFSGELPTENKDCLYDISVTINEDAGLEGGIKQNQGSNYQDVTSPAGNIFSDVISGYDQYQYINYGNNITYWKHAGSFNYEIISPTRYNIETPPPFTPKDNTQNYTFIREECCPSQLIDYTINEDSVKTLLSNIDNEIDSIQAVLSLSIDKGNTNLLNAAIKESDASDSILLRNQLLSGSPFLSDTVISSAIKKEDVLTADLITQVLMANPQTPKSNKLMSELDSRFDQLSDEQWNMVLDGIGVIGAKELIENELSFRIKQRSDGLRKLIAKYKKCYSQKVLRDTIMDLLDKDISLRSKFDLVIEYLCDRDTMSAINEYENIATKFSLNQRELEQYQKFGEYLSFRVSSYKTNFPLLNPDSFHTMSLKSLYTGDGTLADVYARDYLIAIDSVDYTEPVVLPELFLKQGNRINVKNIENQKLPLYSIFPNPASDYFIIHYNGFETDAEQKLEIATITGQEVMEITLGFGTTFKIVDVSFLPSGLYLLLFKNNGTLKDEQKLVISK